MAVLPEASSGAPTCRVHQPYGIEDRSRSASLGGILFIDKLFPRVRRERTLAEAIDTLVKALEDTRISSF